MLLQIPLACTLAALSGGHPGAPAPQPFLRLLRVPHVAALLRPTALQLKRDAEAKEILRQEYEDLCADRLTRPAPRTGPFPKGKAEPNSLEMFVKPLDLRRQAYFARPSVQILIEYTSFNVTLRWPL